MSETSGTLLLPIRHVLRVVLEAATPLSIASGEADPDHDTCLMRDWNGLPCLPGTAIAGVLRALHEDYAAWFGPGTTEALFGFIDHRGKRGAASRLMVSFGLVHDQHDRPVDAYRLPGALGADPVLRLLAGDAPLLRERVALDAHGVAADTAKFDRAACPIGTRFSVELALDGAAETSDDDARLLAGLARLFAVPYARFGGATRGGFGRLAVVRAHAAAIDRRGAAGRDAWIGYRGTGFGQVPAPLFAPLADDALAPPPAETSRRHPLSLTLTLRPQGLWRMGQGDRSWTAGEAANQVPLSEPVIRWRHGRGEVVATRTTPVPASGIKGALAHRAEFHLRRLGGQFAGQAPDDARHGDALFGAAHGAAGGVAGALLIDDGWLDYRTAKTPAGERRRTSIDRHTGGVRPKLLFSDQALWRDQPITLSLTLLQVPQDGRMVPLTAETVTALDWAIEDLCEGRLAIGAGGAGGYGVMAGTLTAGAGGPATSLGAALAARGGRAAA